jgi:hypothetical protein
MKKFSSTIPWLLVAFLAGIIAKETLKPERASAATAQDIVVMCPSCSFPGLPEGGHMVLMDRTTGDIWIYTDNAMAGNVAPIKWGRLTLGNPVVRNK